MGLDVSELRRLAADMDVARRETPEQASTVVRSSTLRGESLSKAKAPVLTGFLKNSITSETETQGFEYNGVFGPEASYGGYVHDGTRHMAPRPFNSQALDVVEPQFYEAVEAIGEPFGAGRG